MKQILSVMRFEFLLYAKSPTFIGVTIFMVVVALIGPMLPAAIQMFSDVTGERSIAVVDTTGRFDGHTLSAFIEPAVSFFTDIEEARAAVSEGRHDYAVELREWEYTLYVTSMGFNVMMLEGNLNSMYSEQYLQEAFASAGVGPEQTAAILEFSPASDIMSIGADGDITADTVDNFFENFIYSYVMGFVLYFGILFGGQHLMTTVIREKSTKTMELLITSCKAVRLLNGKVLGVGAAVLLQILLIITAALISMYLALNIAADIDDIFVVNLQADILIFLVIFFILGFTMFSYMYAALASTVSRMEDAGSISALPVMLIIVGFLGSIFGMQNPGAGWVTIM